MISICISKQFAPTYDWAAKICVLAALVALISICAAEGKTVIASDGGATPAFQTLVNFDGTDGSFPHYGWLVQGVDGDLYGMDGYAGRGNCGTVFKMTLQGALTTLFNFLGDDNGCHPDGGLMLATDGNIYGSTTDAGTFGVGTLFRVTAAGTLTTTHEFNRSDGANVNSALVETVGGLFWGTTVNGGISGCGPSGDGCGVIFRTTPKGVLTVVHSFDFTDGWDPQDATLIQATDEFFYGETAGGGPLSCTGAIGCGTLFKISPYGMFATVHKFSGKDGYVPLGGLIQSSDGNLYGTTYYGGAYGNGTVFKMSLSGVLTTLHSFDGTDGAQPRGRLLQATDGNFYGTTYGGGTNGDGTIFQMTPSGTLTTLHNFDGTDGSQIESGLMQATNGILYGITSAGGTSNGGTIFSVSLGFSPFVSLVFNSGAIGQTAEILGQGFRGTTEVSFNGTPAVFTVKSDVYLTATVPVGATTGVVTVTTPGGTLASNNAFRVSPRIFSFSPTSGPTGTSVVITGQSFTQATEVSLDCKHQMSFTVDSDTQITAIVPTGAPSGEIGVTTAGGHRESSAIFTVTP